MIDVLKHKLKRGRSRSTSSKTSNTSSNTCSSLVSPLSSPLEGSFKTQASQGSAIVTSNNSSTEGSFKKGKQAGPGVILNQAGLSPKHSPKPGPTPVLAQDDRSPERTLCRIDEWSLRSDSNSSSSRDGSLQVKGAETTSQKEEEGAQKTAEGAVSDEVKGAEDAGAEAAEKAEEAEEAKEEREAAKAEGAGEASDCDEMGRPLFDPSPFEGLPKQAIQTICGMFFNSQSDFGCHAQLLAIRDSVVGGETLSPGDPNCMLGKMLHQLGGSSLQAGAFALGTRVKDYKDGVYSLTNIDGVEELEDLLRRTEAAVRRRGLL